MISHIHPDNTLKEQSVKQHLEETAKIAEQFGKPLGMSCIV